MGDDDLEKKVKRSSRWRSAGAKTLIALSLLGGSYVLGRVHEAKDNGLYASRIRKEVKELAVDGYAWKEGADPAFYGYRAVLVPDSSSMTMQGYMVRLTPTDTIVAGPIRKDGVIGFSVYDKMRKGLEEDAQDAKDLWDKASEKAVETAKDTYRWLEQKYDRIVGNDSTGVDAP